MPSHLLRRSAARAGDGHYNRRFEMPAYVEMSPVRLKDSSAAARARQAADALELGDVVLLQDEGTEPMLTVPYTMAFQSTPQDLMQLLHQLAREDLISGPQIVRIYAESDELSTAAVLVPGRGAIEVDYDAVVPLPGAADTLHRAYVPVLTDGRLALWEDAAPTELLEMLGLAGSARTDNGNLGG
jgi:hypothetical protein